MVNIMRRYQQTLMLIVTIIIIISFTWFFTDYRGGRAVDDAMGRIYDRPVRLAEFERGLRRVQLLRGLGLNELVAALAGNPRSEQEYQKNVVFNTYVLRHEADTLGLTPTPSEAIEETKKMPAFQSPSGGFDPKTYDLVVQNIGSMGFGAEAIEEAAMDSLRFQKLKALFESTISAPPSAVRELYELRNRKSEVALVRLNKEDVTKTVTISDEDLKKAFEERKDSLKTDELRKIRYVSFVLSEEEKKLAGPQKGAAFQKLMEKANDFSVAMTEKDAKFEEVAKKFQVEVKETPEFSQANPPAELAQARPLIQEVFTKLTLEQPNSDAVVTPSGYYIAQLTGVTAARPQTFDEAKTKLAETLKNERVTEAMELKGKELRAKLEAELKAGKTFAEAAQAAGVAVETIPAFALSDPPKPEIKDEELVRDVSAEMTEGQLSEVLTTSTGSLIFRVEKRLPIDEAAFATEKTKLVEDLTRFQTRSTFPLWLTERQRAANAESKLGS